MNDNSTEKTTTPVEELRQAAQTLRCDHSFPCAPPHGSLARPGDCNKCGTAYGPQAVVDELIEPLAEWLETEARMVDVRGLSNEGHTFHALKVARAINGTAR